jgi:uncharacterized cupredoxin-like copper-binding protein
LVQEPVKLSGTPSSDQERRDTVGHIEHSFKDVCVRIRSTIVMTASLTAVLVLTACSGSDPAEVETTTEEAADDAVGEDAVGEDTVGEDTVGEDTVGEVGNESPMGDSMDHADDEVMGEPADASEATRTIAVEAFDMAFDPEAISVELGEVVTFEVTNTGEAVHEFFLGDSAMQQEHADEMADMDSDMAHDEPYSIQLQPGETKQLTWRFAETGEVEFACHEPGHYQAGMHGRISVG